MIESAALAQQLSAALDSGLRSDAYEVLLVNDEIQWIEGEVRHTSEPGAGFLRRLWLGLLSILPIEWLL